MNVSMSLNAKDGISPVLRRAGKAVSDTGQKINRFSRFASMAGQRASQFGKRLIGAAGTFTGFNRGARQARRDLDLYIKSQRRATQETSRFKKVAMGAFAGAAIAMGGSQPMGKMGGVVGTAADYQASIDKVAAVANIRKGSSDYNMLNDQAKQLGANTWASSSQVASGQQFLAMAGFDPNEIKAAMPSMLDLSKGGDLDLGATADITSNILSGYGMEASETGKLSDVLAATITTSNTNLSMLGDTMKYVAPIAAKMNGTIGEGAAMAGMLGNVGIQGSQAGTTLRAMYSRMASPPKMAEKAMASIGLNIKDANGQLKSMPTLLKEVHAKTAGMSKDKRMDIFKKMAGQEAMAGFAELVDQAGSGALDAYIKKVNGMTGFASMLSKQMSDNLKGDLTSMGSATEAIKISMGETMLPGARSTVQSITKMMRGINRMIKFNPQAAKTIMMIAGALAAVGVATGGLMLLSPVLLAMLSPIGLLVGGLTAGAAVIAANWGGLNSDFKRILKSFGRLSKFIIQDVGKIAKSLFKGDWAGVASAFDDLKYSIGKMSERLWEGIELGSGALDRLFGFDQGTVLGKIKPIFNAIGQFATGFSRGFMQSMQIIGNAFGFVWKGAKQAGSVIAKFTSYFGKITEGSRIFERFGQVVGWAAAVFVPFIAIKGIIASVAGALGMFGTVLAPLGMALGVVKFAALGLGRALLMNPIGLLIAGIAGGAYLIIRNWSGIKEWFSNLWGGIKNNISQKWQAIKNLFIWKPVEKIKSAWSGLSAALSSPIDIAKGAASLAWSGVKLLFEWHPVNLITKNWSGIKSAAGSAVEGAKTKAEATWNIVKSIFEWSPIEIIKEKWSGITDVVLAPINKAQEKLSQSWNALKGVFGRGDKEKSKVEMIATTPDTATLETKKLIVSDIQAGLQQIPGLTNNVNTALQSMKSVLQAESWQNEGQRLMQTLAAGIKAGTNAAVAAVQSATAQMDAYLPHSDAKIGALSNLTASGAALMPTFAQGIRSTANAPVMAIQPALTSVGQTLKPMGADVITAPQINSEPQGRSVQMTVHLTQHISGGSDANEIASQAAAQTREALNGALTDIGDL